KEIADLLNRKEFIISFITELELLSFPFEDKNEYNQIKKLLSECTIIDINSEIKQAVLNLRKLHKLKLPDSIVCATALTLDLPLFTADKQLLNLDLVNIVFYQFN
ncbi:MAG: type II toxin-antitoxin system VapC family toxin, partial [Opitutaceae bacterium]|nr:type II toxin-antitoxin system VapC family toxin [Cytophagales bacterium]